MAIDKPRESVIERHIQSAIGVVLVALVGWVGLSIYQQAASIATLSERVLNLQEQMADMRNDMRFLTLSRYTKEDAVRDMSVVTDRIKSLDNRVSKLEEKYRQ